MKKDMANNGCQTQIPDRSVANVDNLQNEKPQKGFTESTKKLGVHKSKVQRLLEGLASRLFARVSGNDNDSLGMKVRKLGVRAVACFDVHRNFKTLLQQLVATIGETTRQLSDAEIPKMSSDYTPRKTRIL